MKQFYKFGDNESKKSLLVQKLQDKKGQDESTPILAVHVWMYLDVTMRLGIKNTAHIIEQ